MDPTLDATTDSVSPASAPAARDRAGTASATAGIWVQAQNPCTVRPCGRPQTAWSRASSTRCRSRVNEVTGVPPDLPGTVRVSTTDPATAPDGAAPDQQPCLASSARTRPASGADLACSGTWSLACGWSCLTADDSWGKRDHTRADVTTTRTA